MLRCVVQERFNLGVTGHFFSRKDRRRHTVTLAVRRVTGSHTAVNIRVLLDEILSEWNIGHGEIFAIITDNGSNMVAAFKEQVQLKQDDDCMEEIADTDIPSDEEQNFLDCEEDHDAEFISYNRIGCFSHTLQLVVNNFGKVSSFKEVMKHAHALVKKFNSSTKATERLIALSGKKLTKDCPIRWSSTFLMVNRMIEVKDHLKNVLNEQRWDDLAASEWRMLQHIVNLLQPFAKFTSLLSADEFTTLSCVVPAIMDLNIHLEEVCYFTLALYFAYFTVTRFISIIIMHVIHANIILYTACSLLESLSKRYNYCFFSPDEESC